MSKRQSQKKSPNKSSQTKSISEQGRNRSVAINMRRQFSTLLLCLLLVAAVLAVYWHVWSYDFINLDDPTYVTKNGQVQDGLSRESVVLAFTTDHAGFRIPLTWLSLMLDFEFYGLYAGGYHLSNLLLHLANVLLLFLTLKRMTGALWRSGFVAALFALHPLHVESVAWVTERKDVLSTLFWLLTMWGYLRYVERRRIERYLLIIVFFTLGLMSKPMLVTLPFVLLLLDYWPLGRLQVGQSGGAPEAPVQPPNESRQPRSVFGLVWEKTLLFALSAACSVVVFLAQKSVGAVVYLETWPVKIRIANGLLSYVKYMGKMIWPHPLAVFYPHPGDNLPMWQAAGAGVLLLCISILVVRGARRYPYLAVGWLWYLVTLLPVIGFVQVGMQAMADRFTYVPLIGLYVIIAWGVPEFLRKWHHRRAALAITAASVLLCLMAFTWSQVRLWENSFKLFEHTLRVTDNNYLVHNSLGGALDEVGKYGEAFAHYTDALHINSNIAETHYNMGIALARQGRPAEAMAHYSEALRIKPNFAKAYNNLGDVLLQQGRHDEAISHFFQALQIKSDYAEAHNNLGIALARQGRLAEAMAHYSEALRIEPNNAEAYNNLGIALARQGNLDEATTHFTKAVEIKPTYAEAHNNLGVALLRKGRLESAKEHFIKALQLKPDHEKARKNLEWVLQTLETTRETSTTVESL